MPCTITPDGGQPITFQVNPTVLDVTNDEEQGAFRALRGGNYPYHAGHNPETIQLEVELPDNRPSYPNAGAWQPPGVYIHALQSAVRESNGRVYVDFPEADVGAWYLCKQIREHYQGGFMDVGLTITLTEHRRIAILTTSEAAAQQPGGSAAADTTDPPPVAPDQGGFVDTGAPTAGGDYLVVDGDTVSGISQMAYGDTVDAHLQAIIDANPDAIPNGDASLLQSGATIHIPDLTTARRSGFQMF